MSLNGVVLVNKPAGMTSHDVVARARRSYNMKNIGHAGTLDPLATGLLVLLFGEGTKLSDYLLNGDKVYEIKILLGYTSETLDVDSELVAQGEFNLSAEQIADAVSKLQGPIELSVPKYSAVKVKGQKSVDAARKNKEFQAPIREMNFYEVSLLEVQEKSLRVKIHCAKGSYMRAWAHELGQRLGCGAVIQHIHRLNSAPFSVDEACDFSSIEEGRLELDKAFVPVENCLVGWSAFTLVGKDERLMANGQVPHMLVKRLISRQKKVNNEQVPEEVKVLRGSTGQLLSLLQLQPFKSPRIRRIFSY